MYHTYLLGSCEDKQFGHIVGRIFKKTRQLYLDVVEITLTVKTTTFPK